MIEIRFSQSQCDIFLRQPIDDGLTNRMSRIRSAGALPKDKPQTSKGPITAGVRFH